MSSVPGSVMPASSWPRPDVGEALAVLGRGPVERPVHGVAPEVEVEIVLEGHADAAVDLHAVLHQLGAVVADERLGAAEQLVGIGRPIGDAASVAASLMAWLASSQVFMSAKRCLSSW